MRTIVLAAGLAVMTSPLLAQPQPVALKGAPGRWTLNGRPVLDEVLQVRLRMVFETRADKRLYFGTDAGVSYGQAVETMGMARMAGAEELALLSENGRIEDASSSRIWSRCLVSKPTCACRSPTLPGSILPRTTSRSRCAPPGPSRTDWRPRPARRASCCVRTRE